MFYIRKFKYPLFVEDITEIDPEVTKFPMEFNTFNGAFQMAKNIASYNAKVLESKYDNVKFITETESTDTDTGNSEIIKVSFVKDKTSYIVMKYQVIKK